MAISLNALDPGLAPFAQALVDVAGANGLQPRVTSTRRSYDEQRALYNRYLRGLQRFPVAPPGTSAHETGEAFDMLVTPVEYLAELGELWVSWGGSWGGYADPVHFQLRGAPSPELLLQTKSQSALEAKPGTIGAWVQEEFGRIPWYLSFFLPVGTTMESADSPVMRNIIKQVLPNL